MGKYPRPSYPSSPQPSPKGSAQPNSAPPLPPMQLMSNRGSIPKKQADRPESSGSLRPPSLPLCSIPHSFQGDAMKQVEGDDEESSPRPFIPPSTALLSGTFVDQGRVTEKTKECDLMKSTIIPHVLASEAWASAIKKWRFIGALFFLTCSLFGSYCYSSNFLESVIASLCANGIVFLLWCIKDYLRSDGEHAQGNFDQVRSGDEAISQVDGREALIGPNFAVKTDEQEDLIFALNRHSDLLEKMLGVFPEEDGELNVAMVNCNFLYFNEETEGWVNRGAGSLRINEQVDDETKVRIVGRIGSQRVVINSIIAADMLLEKVSEKRIKMSVRCPETQLPQLFQIHSSPESIAIIHPLLEDCIARIISVGAGDDKDKSPGDHSNKDAVTECVASNSRKRTGEEYAEEGGKRKNEG